MVKLTLVPYCGLCNRLTTIESALLLRREHPEYELRVLWERADDCRAWFDELFLPIEGLPVERLTQWYLVHKGKRYLWLPRLVRRFLFDAEMKCREAAADDRLLRPDPSWRNIYVCGYNAMCSLRDYHQLGRLFRPVPRLEERILAVTLRYNSSTVGVHVRRTDHAKVIAHSPMERYVERMKEMVAEDAATQFFVASDDEEVKTLLRQTFGQRVLTAPSVLERDSLRGMEDAVVELYCLGRTQRLLGSDFSTYSRLAAALYDIPSEDIETGQPFTTR